MCLVHHLAGKPKMGDTPTLTNLAFAGFQEWARQWLLLNHAARRQHGRMKLKMAVGGSAGHGGEFELDVDEGRPEDPLVGRQWVVDVTDMEAETDESLEVAKQAEPHERLLELIKSAGPDGVRRRQAKEKARLDNDVFNAAATRLIKEELIVAEDVIHRGQETKVLRIIAT